MLNKSSEFYAYDEKFFVHKLWKTTPHPGLFENIKRLTEEEQQYFKEIYPEFFLNGEGK